MDRYIGDTVVLKRHSLGKYTHRALTNSPSSFWKVTMAVGRALPGTKRAEKFDLCPCPLKRRRQVGFVSDCSIGYILSCFFCS